MMRGIAPMLEDHHGVQVLDEAVEAAVALSHRYISGRQLPDKAVSVLDTACARVAIGQNALPPELEDCRRRIEALETELALIARERDLGPTWRSEAGERATSSRRTRTPGELELEERWEQEKGLVERSSRSRANALQDGDGATAESAAAQELVRLRAERRAACRATGR